MDITQFIVSSRDKALLYGDYSTYRTQLSNRLLKCRQRLKIASKHKGKYVAKPQVTAEQVRENVEFLHLQLMTSERAWAHAMAMKSAHTADTRGISAHTRSHIVSRLTKASKAAEHLADIISTEPSTSDVDMLEARAYAALLRGAAHFENRSWEPCLRSYSTARVVYSALSSTARADTFKDLLSETIDPSIRYAAYQLKTPRSLTIPSIARTTFPRDDERLLAAINKANPDILKESERDDKRDLSGSEGASTKLIWRGREVRIEDALIATAWDSLQDAKAKLAERISSDKDILPKDMAAAYDDVLIVSQDAVDATKQAIDELKTDGVAQGDSRMQSLYITRTAVNYEMISWRIGRNRVLTGEHDGALSTPEAVSHRKRKAAQKAGVDIKDQPDPPGRQIARLKEKVVLYEGTLQSLDTIKELPGVAADAALASQIEATHGYFTALKSLAIARSHLVARNPVNALVLTKHGFELAKTLVSGLTEEPEQGFHDITVGPSDAKFLHDLLKGEVQRCRALVDIEKLQKDASTGAKSTVPLGNSLNEYPGTIDLDNIVQYPPQLAPVPAKPLFFDVAWNYIDYPSTKKAKTGAATVSAGKGASAASAPAGEAASDGQPKKKGWFGW